MSKKLFTEIGIIKSFNVSPKGHYEGLLLEGSSGTVQLNFPRESRPEVAELAPAGTEIEAQLVADETSEKSCHPVFEVVSIRRKGGREVALADGNGSGARHFEGVVERLNYALHGEVNGAVLDTGDFLHLKPHGARAIKLDPGMRIAAIGVAKPTSDGRHVIEAQEVNGIRIEQKRKAVKKHPR